MKNGRLHDLTEVIIQQKIIKKLLKIVLFSRYS